MSRRLRLSVTPADGSAQIRDTSRQGRPAGPVAIITGRSRAVRGLMRGRLLRCHRHAHRSYSRTASSGTSVPISARRTARVPSRGRVSDRFRAGEAASAVHDSPLQDGAADLQGTRSQSATDGGRCVRNHQYDDRAATTSAEVGEADLDRDSAIVTSVSMARRTASLCSMRGTSRRHAKAEIDDIYA